MCYLEIMKQLKAKKMVASGERLSALGLRELFCHYKISFSPMTVLFENDMYV